jgi:hypothetical protein
MKYDFSQALSCCKNLTNPTIEAEAIDSTHPRPVGLAGFPDK